MTKFKLTALTAAMVSATLLVGCGSNSTDDNKTDNQSDNMNVSSLNFVGISYPKTDADKRAVRAADAVTINGTKHKIGFNTILRSGDKVGTGTFGQLFDFNGKPIKTSAGLDYSNSNDHSSLIDKFAGKLYMVSQFEDRVGVNYITELSQDSKTGELKAVSTKPIDTSAIGGTWTHCAGSRTPWKSHLGSEEYEPNAAMEGSTSGMEEYFGGDTSKVNPYNYGYITEITVTGTDMGTSTFAKNAKLVKHYSMGRLAFELGKVMPNQKTAYMSDDGTNVGFFRYEADKAQDLSAGTLYAAKLTQKSKDNGGSFDISWIDLGHATDMDVKKYIDNRYTFADMFEVGAKDACDTTKGFKLITTTTGTECLKVKAGMEKVASRLETRRYAALLGATTELKKEEGITISADGKKLYVAMSNVGSNMADGKGDINVTKNACGVVYELDLDENYVAKNMTGLVSGRPVTKVDPQVAGFETGNKCHVNGIANPDNLTMMPNGTLIIGEDTGSGHQNDLIWALDIAKQKKGEPALTRILSTPYGSETTSPYYYPNINGFGYLMTVVQHPYGESDQGKATSDADRRAYTGYVGAFPAMNMK